MQIAYTPTPVRIEQFGKEYGVGASLLGSMATGFTAIASADSLTGAGSTLMAPFMAQWSGLCSLSR